MARVTSSCLGKKGGGLPSHWAELLKKVIKHSINPKGSLRFLFSARGQEQLRIGDRHQDTAGVFREADAN